jgi:hypothetical protein
LRDERVLAASPRREHEIQSCRLQVTSPAKPTTHEPLKGTILMNSKDQLDDITDLAKSQTAIRGGTRMRTLAIIAGMTLSWTGCIMGPRNGDAVSGDVEGKSLSIEGFHSKPSIPVQIQVLKQPGLDPKQDGNWTVLATASSGTTPIHWNSTDPRSTDASTTTLARAGRI